MSEWTWDSIWPEILQKENIQVYGAISWLPGHPEKGFVTTLIGGRVKEFQNREDAEQAIADSAVAELEYWRRIKR